MHLEDIDAAAVEFVHGANVEMGDISESARLPSNQSIWPTKFYGASYV